MAVFGVAHPRRVETVAAVVVPQPGASLPEEAVITHTPGLLTGHKTPKRVVITDAISEDLAAGGLVTTNPAAQRARGPMPTTKTLYPAGYGPSDKPRMHDLRTATSLTDAAAGRSESAIWLRQ